MSIFCMVRHCAAWRRLVSGGGGGFCSADQQLSSTCFFCMHFILACADNQAISSIHM